MLRAFFAFVLLAGPMLPLPVDAHAPQSQGAASETNPASVALWRVYFTDANQLNRLAREIDVWEVQHERGYFVAPLAEQQRNGLTLDGFRLEPDDRQFTPPRHLQISTAEHSDAIPGFACYRTVEKTYADLEALTFRHPNLAEWIDIGDSWERSQQGLSAGFDIKALVLTNNELDVPKFHFLVVAAVHSRELVTAELAARFAEYLVAGYSVDPNITWLLDYGEVHIVPFVNPDGRKLAEQGYLWRKNTNNSDGCTEADPLRLCYGVDLNRNSSFQWAGCESGGCSSGDACSTTYRGSSPASEPETRALQAYVQSLFPDQRGPDLADAADDSASGLFVTLHSYGNLVMFPWGWNGKPSPNDAGLRALARKLAEPLGYRSCQAGEWGCLYQTDGTNDDWVYGELGVAAFTFELGGAFFEECHVFEGTIQSHAIDALEAAFRAARRPYAVAAAPEIDSFTLSPDRISAGTPVTAAVTVDLPAGLQAPVTLRYSIDSPSWISDTVVITVTAGISGSAASPVTVNSPIDTADLRPGRHLVFVEATVGAGPIGSPRAAWLDVTAKPASFDVSPAADSGTGSPGTTVTYAITVTNTGIASDTYTVSAASSAWPATLDMERLRLSVGEQGVVIARVTVPDNARPGETDTARIHLVSSTDSTVNRTVQLRTSAGPLLYYYPFVNASRSVSPE